jgi:hypothetical protein
MTELPSSNRRRAIGALLLAAASVSPLARAATSRKVLRIPAPESALDTRSDYQRELLTLALRKAGQEPQLQLAERAMSQGQTVEALQRGEILDVAWFATSPERESQLRPIRLPIDKGLLGWRIAIVRAERFDLFRGITKPAGLRRFTAVQGEGWPDVEVLRANGLRVVTSPDYEQNFALLARQKADYFPRSVLEYRAELERHREAGLVEEPYAALVYPAASYFFVAPDNTELANLITQGLERALRDGSFDRLFYRYHASVLESAGLERRALLQLENPIFGDAAPLSRKELWFRPDYLAARGRHAST